VLNYVASIFAAETRRADGPPHRDRPPPLPADRPRQIKQHLRQYISQGELIGRAGKESIAIPLPQIELPHFTFSHGEEDGVGAGDGEPGGDAGEGSSSRRGGGPARPRGGRLARRTRTDLGEELALPRIQPAAGRGDGERERYTGVRRVGPRGSVTSSAPQGGAQARAGQRHVRPENR